MELAGKHIGIYVGPDETALQGTVEMNEIGAFVWNLLENDITEDAIYARVLEEYEGDEAFIRSDIHEMLSIMKENGVIEE